jgi:predicted ATP-grasp superfamily ATP-dependent carboligase
MAVVNNREELELQFNECRKVKVDVTVQEIIPGDVSMGFNFNSLFYDGKIRQGFTASKVRMTADGYGIPVVVKSREMIDALRENSEKLLTAIGYEGYSCIEYKLDQRDGIYKLLEVNGRYNRSSLLSVKLGVNFPWMEYNRLVNGTEITSQSYRKGVYYIDEFKDVQINIRSLLHGKQNVFSFLRPYFSRRVFAVFSYKDPGPFLKHAADGIRLFVRAGRRRCTAACGVPGVVKAKETL